MWYCGVCMYMCVVCVCVVLWGACSLWGCVCGVVCGSVGCVAGAMCVLGGELMSRKDENESRQ